MTDSSQFESFLTNGYVECREGDGPIFFQAERKDGRDVLAVRMDRYAVIPMERYEALMEPGAPLRVTAAMIEAGEKALNDMKFATSGLRPRWIHELEMDGLLDELFTDIYVAMRSAATKSQG